MRVSSRVVVTLLGLWTCFVWGTRISNVLADDGSSTLDRVLTVGFSLVLIALAVAGLAVAWWGVRAGRRLTSAGANLLLAFSVLTIVTWVIRVPMILLTDQSVGFKVVHAALGVISVALAIPVGLASRQADPNGADHHDAGSPLATTGR